MDENYPTVPQWKRDLISRIRLKSKRRLPSNVRQQLLAGTSRNTSVEVEHEVQQPSITCSSVAVPVVNPVEYDNLNGNVSSSTLNNTKMVQDCSLIDHKHFNLYSSINEILENGSDKCGGDSSSSEDLHYGPGIVNKLKNRYLSLTLRENNVKPRPSILSMRKATSLENLLDDDDDVTNSKPIVNSRLYQSRYKDNNVAKNIANRYYNATRGSDLKRARSVEAISRIDDHQKDAVIDNRKKHQSLHEDMLIIKEGNDNILEKMYDKTLELNAENKVSCNTVTHRINRPKRISPIMSEREKPPVDVVKQTKRLFEGRPEQRTKLPHQTGEVAAKVASYKNIIGQTKSAKKPPIYKQKPVLSPDKKPLKPSKLGVTLENGWVAEEGFAPKETSSPHVVNHIPDVSRINNGENSSRNQANTGSSLSETPDLILHSSPIKNASSPTFKILATENFLKAEINHSNSSNKVGLNGETSKKNSPTRDEKDGFNKSGTTPKVASFNIPSSHSSHGSHLPVIDKEPLSNSANSTKSPFQLDKNTHTNKPNTKTDLISQLLSATKLKPILSPQEIEKNKINTAKTLETANNSSQVFVKSIDEVPKIAIPATTTSVKPKDPREQNSIVFKFTDRKDVPDYVGNDGRIRTGKMEKPKVGEGGIIILPGVSLDESFVDDDDEEWKLSLEGPPSPCNVMFINDNVLIDGRSSLSQKSKKSKMKIKFVESIPDIFEYPSESSLLDEIPTPTRESSPGHTVPSLGGSTLANYIPKSGSSEDFKLGITRSLPTPLNETYTLDDSDSSSNVPDEPVLFSAGTNSDILF